MPHRNLRGIDQRPCWVDWQKAVEILHLPATDSTAPEIAGFVEKAKSIMMFALGYSMLRDFYL
jgi:hypothetical protein